jgi:hypothetical protein
MKGKFDKERPITKHEIIQVLDQHYKDIGRTNPPKYQKYNMKELRMCLRVFNISLIRIKD